MRSDQNEQAPLLFNLLMVILLITLAACSKLSRSQPAAATVENSIPTPVKGQSPAAESTLVELPLTTGASDALRTLDPANTIAQTTETLPAVNWQAVQPCSGQPVCANLLVTQSGKPERVGWSAQGLLTEAMKAVPTAGTRWVIDTGTPSPDGKWVAFTSLGYEAGGPVYLQNLESSEWVNLIEQINAHKAEGQPDFPLDLNWDVIGWFPDSQRLMIGPSDLSSVVIIDRASYSAQVIGFPGGGKGGMMFVTLAPNGKSFTFFGENEVGQQTISSYDLASGQISTLQVVAYEEGFLSNPRFSPDSSRIAYIVQSGQPETGLTYALNVQGGEGGMFMPSTIAKGNLSMTAPSWSPDGSYIAFTRNDAAPMLTIVADAHPPEPQGNVWVVSVKDGSEKQITFIDGLARSPVWANDGKTLAFVTHSGEIGLASVDQPGQIWQAAGPSELPELANVFFIP